MSSFYSVTTTRRFVRRTPTTNTHQSLPGAVPPIAVSERFLQTISRASDLVTEDHPLQYAANSLVALSNRSMRVTRQLARDHPKIIYDTFKVKNTKKDPDKCPICLSEYEEGEDCGVLPCKHTFHNFCLRTWVDSKRTCPLCRLQLG